MSTVVLTGIIAILFALVHAAGGAMAFLRVTPRSIWLSFAGGVSLAYVFVHLLPELAEHQERSLSQLEASGSAAGLHVYLTALAGLVLFYGLERMVRQSRAQARSGAADDCASDGVYGVHLGSYAVYNILIGYLLVHREQTDSGGLLLYAVALGLHFLVNDQGLREHHGSAYDKSGRWILAVAPLAGWGLGLVIDLSPVAIATIFAFLAGGIVLNVLKEELPEDRESRFWALALGAAAFALLLMFAG